MKASGGHSMYLTEERSTCARMVNKYCKEEPLLTSRMPLNPEDDDLFHAMADGLILIHLLNFVEKDTIDMRTVNKQATPNIY